MPEHSLSILARVVAPLGLAAAVLAGCATSPGTSNRYAEEYESLAADCRAREGVLVPTGTQTGQPARDNACRLSGAATRIP